MKALLVIDMLNDFMKPGGALYCRDEARKIIPFVVDKVTKARKDGIKVIFVCDNHNHCDNEFRLFPAHCVAGTEGAKIIEELPSVLNCDVYKVKKTTFDGFFNTELDSILKHVNEVEIVGVCTSICVMDTAASATRLGYKVRVFKDGVADFDPAAHEFALKRMKSLYGIEIL